MENPEFNMVLALQCRPSPYGSLPCFLPSCKHCFLNSYGGGGESTALHTFITSFSPQITLWGVTDRSSSRFQSLLLDQLVYTGKNFPVSPGFHHLIYIPYGLTPLSGATLKMASSIFPFGISHFPTPVLHASCTNKPHPSLKSAITKVGLLSDPTSKACV